MFVDAIIRAEGPSPPRYLDPAPTTQGFSIRAFWQRLRIDPASFDRAHAVLKDGSDPS